MMKCPSCGLVGRDAETAEPNSRKLMPPVGALVLCECGAVNRAEAPGDALQAILGARALRTLTTEEFDALPREVRSTLEASIEAFKRAGRFGPKATRELDVCRDCGHERRQHLDPRWPCNMLACGCRGFLEPRKEITP
jgi:hypothetical protein